MKKAIILVSILIILFASFIIYEAMNVNHVENFNITMQSTNGCDLYQQDCKVEIPQLGSATFKILPRPILMNKSLTMTLIPHQDQDIEVWVDFLGLEMEMGFNRTKLKRKAGKYQAEGFLPTCTEDKMTWKTTLLIKKGDATYGYEYRFVTKKDEE